MCKPTIVTLGISLALFAALPAHAWQHHGGRQSVPAAGQRGTMMQNRDMTRDRDTTRDRDRLNDGSVIYGSQLMTPAERAAYRSQMNSLKTAREREELRLQHHQEMQQRAAQRGVTLPDTPPSGGRTDGMRTEQQQRTQQQHQQRDQGDDPERDQGSPAMAA